MTDSEFDSFNKSQPEQDEFSLAKYSVKHKQAERKIRKKRKKINRLKNFLRFVLIIVLLFSGYKLYKLPGWYLTEDAYNNINSGKVEIINNNIVPSHLINRAIKDIPISKLPIFLVRVTPVKKAILKIPVIKDVYVRRYGFPARLQIIVIERTPIAVLKTDLKSYTAAFFTSDGVLITNKQYMNLPSGGSILTILANIDNINKNWTITRIHDIEKIAKAVELYSDEKVEYVDMHNPDDVFVKIHTTNIRLGKLDSTVFERIKRIYTILPQITEFDSRIKYIDLRWDKVNYLKFEE